MKSIMRCVDERLADYRAKHRQPKLTDVIYKLDEIEDLNYGGCAHAALGLQDYANKMGIDNEAKVVFIYPKAHQTRIDEIECGMAGSCSHALLLSDGKYYDSTGIYSEDTVKAAYPGGAEIIVMETDHVYECLRGGTWNKSFDRESGIDQIEKILGVQLDKEKL